MARLDGVWDVKRLSGALPPLVGMRKRISGTRGVTLLGPIRMPFDVRGNELHYRAPFSRLVDVIDLGEDVCQGRATFNGKEFGRFELRRAQMAKEKKKDERITV